MMRTWWENEEILRHLRDWLTQTTEEIKSLDNGGSDNAGDTRPGVDPSHPRTADLPEVGLLQLAESFTALRHEVKLQTKGSRSLEAAVNRSLEGLESASRAFQSVQAREQESAEGAALPLVEALIGLDEALLRTAQAFQLTHRQLTREAPARLRDDLDSQFNGQSWWRRFLTRRWHRRVRETAAAALARSTSDEFTSLMQGFGLIQARLAKAFSQLNIHRLDEPGGLVDPTQMTVVELVSDSDAPPETVVEVLRPGYSWGSRAVRFAEVRAVASRTFHSDDATTLVPGESAGGEDRHRGPERLDGAAEIIQGSKADTTNRGVDSHIS